MEGRKTNYSVVVSTGNLDYSKNRIFIIMEPVPSNFLNCWNRFQTFGILYTYRVRRRKRFGFKRSSSGNGVLSEVKILANCDEGIGDAVPIRRKGVMTDSGPD